MCGWFSTAHCTRSERSCSGDVGDRRVADRRVALGGTYATPPAASLAFIEPLLGERVRASQLGHTGDQRSARLFKVG